MSLLGESNYSVESMHVLPWLSKQVLAAAEGTNSGLRL